MNINERNISQQFRFLSIIVSSVLFLLITGVGLYYVYSIKRESAYNIARMAEGLLRASRYREAVNSLQSISDKGFDAIGYYDNNNKRIFVLPPRLGIDFLGTKKSFLSDIAKTNIKIDIYFDEERNEKGGTIIFTYNHTHAAKTLLFFYLVGMALILPILHLFKLFIRKSIEKDFLEGKNKAIQETFRQVRHDITQPLQLLYILAKKGNGLETDIQDKIESACDDMMSIVDDLKEKGDNFFSSQIRSVCLLAVLKEISEKESIKLSFDNKPVILTVEQEAIQAFSKINEMEFKRVMSNLIDNSAQSCESGKSIEISLSRRDQVNVIRIIDKGEGIKPELLAMIGKRGVSFRKNGNGLGISYAIDKVEQWGGRFDLHSNYGMGTTVEITLPREPTPEWFATQVDFQKVQEFVLTDDRPVIHTLVKERLGKINKEMEKVFHHSSNEFSSWYIENKDKLHSPLFIFDYDLGREEMTGTEIIKTFNLSSQSILMTNHYDDLIIQKKAIDAKVRIFPKPLIEYLITELKQD